MNSLFTIFGFGAIGLYLLQNKNLSKKLADVEKDVKYAADNAQTAKNDIDSYVNATLPSYMEKMVKESLKIVLELRMDPSMDREVGEFIISFNNANKQTTYDVTKFYADMIIGTHRAGRFIPCSRTEEIIHPGVEYKKEIGINETIFTDTETTDALYSDLNLWNGYDKSDKVEKIAEGKYVGYYTPKDKKFANADVYFIMNQNGNTQKQLISIEDFPIELVIKPFVSSDYSKSAWSPNKTNNLYWVRQTDANMPSKERRFMYDFEQLRK